MFPKGSDPANKPEDTIDFLLIAKHGNTRMLRVDLRTGAWKAAEDLDLSGDIPLPNASIGV